MSRNSTPGLDGATSRVQLFGRSQGGGMGPLLAFSTPGTPPAPGKGWAGGVTAAPLCLLGRGSEAWRPAQPPRPCHHIRALPLLLALQLPEERGPRSPQFPARGVGCGQEKRQSWWGCSPGLPCSGAFRSGQPGLCAAAGSGRVQRAAGLSSGLEFRVRWAWSQRGETEL